MRFKDNALDNAYTNWYLASSSCMASWMKDAGFKHIFFENNIPKNPSYPRMFIGCSDKYLKYFTNNKNLFYCSGEYFKILNQNLKNFIHGKKL